MGGSRRRLGAIMVLAVAAGTVAGCGAPITTNAGDAGPGDGGDASDVGTDAGPTIDPECEVIDLAEHGCLLPWPSSRFQATGPFGSNHTITLPDAGMPRSRAGRLVSTDAWNGRDGYSPMTSMIVRIDGAIDESALASWRAPETGTGGATVLIDTTAETPVPVAHFAEVQHSTQYLSASGWSADPVDPAFSTLYVRPAQRLAPGHHYVVGIRVHDMHGLRAPSTTTFDALRSETPVSPEVLETRRQYFQTNVFAPLEHRSVGVDRATLVVAWDFWTGSDDDASRDLRAMRDQAFALDAAQPLGCSIDRVSADTDNPNVLQVTGRFDVPYFLDDTAITAPATTETDTLLVQVDPGGSAHLARHAPHEPPVLQGTRRGMFVALVPTSVIGHTAVPIAEYGHGLLNDRHEIATPGVVAPVLVATGTIGISTDAYGLAGGVDDAVPGVPFADSNAIAAAIANLSRFTSVTDRALQGVIAQTVLPQVFVESCVPQFAAHPELAGTTVRSDHFAWIGNSQGGIMGPTIAALDPRFDRVALGVGGISYPIMLPRSCDWYEQGLAFLFHEAYGPTAQGRIVRDLLMVMVASDFDRFEGGTFAPHLASGDVLFPRTESAHILYQVAVNDPGTPEVAGQIAARTLALPYLMTSTDHTSDSRPYGLSPAGPSPTRAFVSFDLHGATVPDGPTVAPDVCTAIADPSVDVHEEVRRVSAAQSQIENFLDTGIIR